MIVGFSTHGRGGASPAINYLTQPQNPDGTGAFDNSYAARNRA
jgi:hypothetical protein